ncbi:MAG: PilZ domain-containing protein [Gammaproteobacteria bacterium]
MMGYKEKRDFFRMTMDCTAEYKVNGSGKKSKAIVKDLSSGGLLLWIKQKVKPGSHISIELKPGKDITPPLNAKVEVVRCDPLENEKDTYAAACSMIEIMD